MSCCDNIKILTVGGAGGGGPYTVQNNTPAPGQITVTDNGGQSFILPVPALLQDGDGDTFISLVESGAGAGGDQITFTVDGTQVGAVEFLAGGVTKWTLNGILDPTVYRPTAITMAVRDTTFTPIAVEGDLIYNSDNSRYEKWDGSTWVPFGDSSQESIDSFALSGGSVDAENSLASHPDFVGIKFHVTDTDTTLTTSGTFNTNIDGVRATSAASPLTLPVGSQGFFYRDAGGDIEVVYRTNTVVVNEVILADDTAISSIDLPVSTDAAADLKIIDVCEISNPAPQVAGGVLGGTVSSGASFTGSFTPTVTGTYTLELAGWGAPLGSGGSTPAEFTGTAWFEVGSTFVSSPGSSNDIFDGSGDPMTNSDLGKTWDINVTAGQLTYIYTRVAAASSIDFPQARVTGFTPQSIAVTADGGNQEVTGDSDSRNWNTGDKILAIPSKVFSELVQSGVTTTQPDNSPNSVRWVIEPGVIELTRGNNGGLYNIITESSWSGGSSPDGVLFRNDTNTTFTDFQSAYDGQIGDFITDIAYGNAEIQIVSSGAIHPVTFNSWQQGGGGGFSLTSIGAGAKVDGWNLIKIPQVGVDFQSGNFATEDLTFIGSRNHDFANNIMSTINVAQLNYIFSNSGSANFSLPSQVGIGSASFNLARSNTSITVVDDFSTNGISSTLRLGAGNTGLSGTDGANTAGFFLDQSSQVAGNVGVEIRTADFSNASVGDVLTLVDVSTGETEYQTPTGGAAATATRSVTTLDHTTEVTLVSGGTNLVFDQAPASTGQMSVNSLTYWDEGTIRYVQMEFSLFDDDSFTLDLGSSAFPLGAVVDFVSYVHDGDENEGNRGIAVNQITGSQFYFNKNNGLDGVNGRITFMVSGVAQGQVVVESITPTNMTQVGTPLATSTEVKYELEWDGTEIVNVLTREYGVINDGHYIIDHSLGTIEQWGVYTYDTTHPAYESGSGAILNFDLPIAFANATYAINAGSNYNPGTEVTERRVTQVDNNTFQVVFGYQDVFPGNTLNQPFSWQAKGLKP